MVGQKAMRRVTDVSKPSGKVGSGPASRTHGLHHPGTHRDPVRRSDEADLTVMGGTLLSARKEAVKCTRRLVRGYRGGTWGMFRASTVGDLSGRRTSRIRPPKLKSRGSRAGVGGGRKSCEVG
jgi:hypothetical protein